MSEKHKGKNLSEAVKCHTCSKTGCVHCKDESECGPVQKDMSLVGNNGGG